MQRSAPSAVELNAPYVGEMVRREMIARYGDATYTAGYQVVNLAGSRVEDAQLVAGAENASGHALPPAAKTYKSDVHVDSSLRLIFYSKRPLCRKMSAVTV